MASCLVSSGSGIWAALTYVPTRIPISPDPATWLPMIVAPCVSRVVVSLFPLARTTLFTKMPSRLMSETVLSAMSRFCVPRAPR